MHQKLVKSFSLDISTTIPKWLKKEFTSLFGGKIGTGPFLKEIGGKGKALIILAFFLTIFFNWTELIVEIKLIIFPNILEG